jgi:hypothetical protein
MTRAEYEARYGSAPKPAPVQMTRAQYQAKYGSTPTPQPAPAAQNGLFSRIKSGVKESFAERDKKVLEAKTRVNQGQQSTASGVFQAVGNAAGLASDTAFTAVKETVRSVAPSAIPAVKKTVGAVMQTKPVQKAAEVYGGFKEKHPTAAANVEAGANIAGIFPQAKVAQVAAKAGTKATVETAKVAGKAAVATGKAAAKAPAGAASMLTNVPRDVFERAADPEWTPIIERAIKHVSDNEKQPYFEVAKRTSEAINTAETQAARRLEHEKMFFKSDNPGARFDVASKYENIVAALKPYRASGLVVESTPGPRNSVVDYKIGQTPQSSFTPREVQKLNELLAKLKASKEVEIDDLLALRQSFSTAYDEIPLGVNGDPRPYHAAVMSLKASAEETIDKILPPGLKQAFAQYRMLEEMKSAIGNKVIDGKGDLKDTAEQFLANLGNVNKGNVRSSAEELKSMTGIDIAREVQAIKDAQKLSENFPRTGSRSQDIIRSLLAAGVGSAAGLGLPGAVAGLAITSPKVMGKAALAVGKQRAKGSTTRKVGDYLKNVQPGLSTKDVSGVTREKLDQVKDYLIEQLPKSSGKLNLDIEAEAADLVEYLQDAKTVTARDVNRGLEVLRLQGKTDIVEKLRRQLGATSQFNRDDAGRFAAKTVRTALAKR